MKTVCLVGQGYSGKSFAIFEAAKWLWQMNDDYEITDLQFDKALYAGSEYLPEKSDLRTVFEVNGKRILFVSATDDTKCINRLIKVLEQLSEASIIPDILVTACRRYDDSAFTTMINQMQWNVKGDKLFDNNGEEIIQIPVIYIQDIRNRDQVIKWYNHLTARLLQHILQELVF